MRRRSNRLRRVARADALARWRGACDLAARRCLRYSRGGAGEDRVALTLGGIANVTLLRRGASPEEAIAFDTGPGGMLIDGFVHERTAGQRDFDRDGALSAAGRVDATLLSRLLAESYFAAPPPKTTGREHFGTHFLAR